MKFLEILLSFLSTLGATFFQPKTESVTDKIIKNARRIVILLVVAAIAAALFCVGFTMAYNAAVANFEFAEGWRWTPHLLGGLLLGVVSCVTLVFALGEKQWLHAIGSEAECKVPPVADSPGPVLEGAIAALIVELAHQLKEKRTHAATPTGETPPL